MRIGVEEAVDGELLDQGAQGVSREFLSVESGPLDGLDIADLHAVDELLGQDLGGGEVAEDGGDVDAGEHVQVLRQTDTVVGLAPVVELIEDTVAELFQHTHEVDGADELRAARDHAGRVLHDADVGAHLVGRCSDAAP